MEPEVEQKQSRTLAESISEGSVSAARKIMLAMHPAEIADALESLPPVQRRVLWNISDPEIDGEILMEVGDEVRESLVRDMDLEELVAATEQLDLDDLADFVQSLPEQLTAEVLAGMGRQDRERLEQVLAFPEDSAGGLMNMDVITVRGDVTLDVVLRYLRRRGEMPKQTDRLWVVDRYGRYLGELSLRLLLTHSTDTLVSDISLRRIEPLLAHTTQREVARTFEDFDLVSAPVVDDNNRLIGRITIDDVVDVIREEAEQSVMSMAGLNKEDDIFAPIFKSSRKRALWLGVNLLTALLASWVIAQFEGTLERVVTLAVLMSVVPSMGGIAGSQTLTLVIRGQALNQINKNNLRDLLTREVAIGLLNGVLWAVIMAALVWLWFGDKQIGMIIGAALIVNLVTAAYAGAMLPMIMKRLGIDPALAGGVALTTITDVVGLVAFLGLATLIL
ncbi:magnesium transporter [Granulosicoccus antarcticus]|uniref:Magnesium transporter MgtE n=1 Tax=Granulosicoccus antarcticus IMCC3135 TaxID=1192854 RepID=A0A2Z2P3D4_9GAMM|nr:magnesium transporter [Granulosicoccus antarcticus]ASJ75930.1 Magnesium transporter MgtE [Granulosicoccus antarcticus IMCC3135]